jgi:NADPH:quinone reductase-like Zn-dependent oxidoreductase
MASSVPPSSFRAWQYTATKGGLEKNLKLNAGLPLPKPKPDQHLVRMIAVALNPVDYKPAEIPFVGRWLVPNPATPGIDFAGRLVAPAAGSGLKAGQLVFGAAGKTPFAAGALSEYATSEVSSTIALPDGIAPVDAAALPLAALTAYQTIVPHVKSGDRVFINAGSGGTGVFGIQIAKALGCHVTTTCSAANIDLCKSLGADEVVDYRSRDVVEALKAQQPRFNHVVDNAGLDPTLYYRCHEYTEPSAVYIMVAGAPSMKGMLNSVLMRVWPGFLGGGKRKLQGFFTQSNPEQLNIVADWVKEGKVKAVIDSRFSFEQAPQAFERLKTGRAKGKIIVDVNPDA